MVTCGSLEEEVASLVVFPKIRQLISDPHVWNDLWRYSEGEWTWMSGNDTSDESGNYDLGGYPGARDSVLSWMHSGSMWLFGGYGIGSDSSQRGYLSDLWKLNMTSLDWEFIGGSETLNSPGEKSQGNLYPSGRMGASKWIQDEYLWVFGGLSFVSTRQGIDLLLEIISQVISMTFGD